jgi:hypothetical protein
MREPNFGKSKPTPQIYRELGRKSNTRAFGWGFFACFADSLRALRLKALPQSP